jgi:hypothetical protein
LVACARSGDYARVADEFVAIMTKVHKAVRVRGQPPTSLT